jgi:hypothetical protein
MKYAEVIEARKLSELITQVVERSEKGWKPVSGVSAVCHNPNNCFSQVMILESIERPKAETIKSELFFVAHK